jgi:hypothetical protein
MVDLGDVSQDRRRDDDDRGRVGVPKHRSSTAVASDGQYLYLLCGAFGRIVVVPRAAP